MKSTLVGIILASLTSCLIVDKLQPYELYVKYRANDTVREIGYDFNKNGKAEQVRIFRLVKDSYILQQVNYDYDEDGKIDVIKNFKEGKYIIIQNG